MVDSKKNKRYIHDSCQTRSTCNVQGDQTALGGQTALRCKNHADDSMMNVRFQYCSH